MGLANKCGLMIAGGICGGLLSLFGLLCGLDPGLVGRFGGFGCFGTLFFFFNCLKIGDFFGFRLGTFGLFGGSSGI